MGRGLSILRDPPSRGRPIDKNERSVSFVAIEKNYSNSPKGGLTMENKKREMTLREYLTRNADQIAEQAINRPEMEIWPDDWSRWLAGHRQDKCSSIFCDSGAKASALCPRGHH